MLRGPYESVDKVKFRYVLKLLRSRNIAPEIRTIIEEITTNNITFARTESQVEENCYTQGTR